MFNPNMRGLRMAILILSKREAEELLEIGHIHEGLGSCRIRKIV